MERERAREEGKSEGERERRGDSDMGGGGVGLSVERGVVVLCQRLTRQHPSEFFQHLFTAFDIHGQSLHPLERPISAIHSAAAPVHRTPISPP